MSIFSRRSRIEYWGGARLCGRSCALLCAALIFSADQQGKAHSSKACLCQWATFEPLSAPFGSAGACQSSHSRRSLVEYWGGVLVWPKPCFYHPCAALIFSADQEEKAHSSKACLCQWATFEPLSAPFGSAGACQFSHRQFLVLRLL